ncbi:Alpha/Beta hydrolase protein [Aspergillus karnatakaensis]|uniref:alpha/beta hydrolase family protein n=1 Tax=Aspergillus karnatakaensis TaxID=1810916 RepID=UPI003CCE05C7
MSQLRTTNPPPRLTPAALVASPLRSLPIPNASGTFAIYTEYIPASEHEQHNGTSAKCAIWVLDMNSPRSWPIPDTQNARYPQWLGNSDEVIWLEACPNGETWFVVADACLRGERYVAGSVGGRVWDLRTTGVVKMGGPEDETDDDLGFVVLREVDESGGLVNLSNFQDQILEEGGVGRPTRLHDSRTCKGDGESQLRTVIWFGSLVRPPTKRDFPSARYTITRVTSLMAYFDLGSVAINSSPDVTSEAICRDFCISSWVILFTARDPELDSATHTAGSCYICPMLDWSGLIVPNDYYKAFRHRGLGGACSSPAVSRGGAVAFLAQKQDGCAADKNRVLIVMDNQKGTYKEIFASDDGKGQWDLSPHRVSFAADGTLLLYVEEQGRRVLYQLANAEKATPADLKRIEPAGRRIKSVLDATPLGEKKSSRVLLTCESFIQPPQFLLHDLVSRSIFEFLLHKPRFGLNDTQLDEIWIPSANGRSIHAWIVKPSFFNPEHKYPLVYAIHDNQHGSWSSTLNTVTGVNLALFAEHGYVVVAPNISGSIGYGEDFVNATQDHYASAGYEDLEAGFKYLEKEVSYIDTGRSVVIGCGYGGYMINWIQGHDLGRRFRALVSCNGVVSILSYLSMDVQHAVFYELGEAPWDSAKEWRRADPAQYLQNWKTPQLVIHDAAHRDFPVSDAVVAVKMLRLRGVECEFLELTGEERKRFILFYHTVFDWMGRLTMG